jgi:hypothetical protein
VTISNPWKFPTPFFQALELFTSDFPTIGNLRPYFSNAWKNSIGLFPMLGKWNVVPASTENSSAFANGPFAG